MSLKSIRYTIIMESQEYREEDRQRFIECMVMEPNGCWLWKRSYNWQCARYDSYYHRGRKRRVHIVAYELMNNIVIPELYQYGRPNCGTEWCCNPEHLTLYKRGTKFKRQV